MAEVTSYPSRVGATIVTSSAIQLSHRSVAEAVYRSGNNIATMMLASTQAVAFIIAFLPHLFDYPCACGKRRIFFDHGFLVPPQLRDLFESLAATQFTLQCSSHQAGTLAGGDSVFNLFPQVVG